MTTEHRTSIDIDASPEFGFEFLVTDTGIIVEIRLAFDRLGYTPTGEQPTWH